MRFEWDEAKRKENLKKHGLDFKRIEKVFDGLTVSVEDDRFDYGEERFITFGILDAELVAVAHTENEHLIRVISMRRATRNEEQRYFSKVSGA